jgi:hypothetical protein
MMQMIRYVAISLAICVFSSATGVFAAVKSVTQPVVSPEQAAVLSLNRISSSPKVITVENNRHNAKFSEDGFNFIPQRGPNWAWSLDYVGPADQSSVDQAIVSVNPIRLQPDVIDYPRAGFTERYVIKRQSIEQRFVIPQSLALQGADLLVSGTIDTKGKLETQGASGWLWRDEKGVVTLGQVTVFDAKGRKLPAEMQVAQNSTLIRVDGKALDEAVYPVVIDPEVGTDFRISEVGGSGDNNENGTDPAVVYNVTEDEYLVVWWGDPGPDEGLGGAEFEIYGQCISAADGSVAKNDFRISDMGTDNSNTWDARFPAVAFNSASNEYLVVWVGDDNTGTLADEEFEVFGQLIDKDCNEKGGDFRISNIGTDGNAATGVKTEEESGPAVAYNSTDSKYLVVWSGDDTLDDFEIYGQLLNVDGTEDGSEFKISVMGTAGDNSAAASPAVAYNADDNEFLVVWWGDDEDDSINNDFDVFGRRIAANGVLQGGDKIQISNVGPASNASFQARFPDVVYNAQEDEYLVVWEGDDDTAPLIDNEFEVFGQLLNADGTEKGSDFRISNMGPNGNINFGVRHDTTPTIEDTGPAVAVNSLNNEYLVAWEGDDNSAPLIDDEYEIYAQRIAADTGAEIGADTRLSDMGGSGNASFDASAPAIAFDSTHDGYLVAWHGNDNTAPLNNAETEIFGQLFSGPATLRVSSLSPSTVAEGSVSTLAIERLGDTTDEVSVSLDTTGGTAASTDFTLSDDSPNIVAGASSVEVQVTAAADSEDENDETVNIALTSPSSSGEVELAPTGTTAVLTITDSGSGGGGGGGGGTTTTTSGGGGGGCTLRDKSGFDPVPHIYCRRIPAAQEGMALSR